MRALHRTGVAMIVLAVLVPPLAIWGPIPFFHFRYWIYVNRHIDLGGPNFIMHDHAYEKYLSIAWIAAFILAGFGILLVRDAARKSKELEIGEEQN